MIGTPYEEWYRTPRDGIDAEEGYVLHMTKWSEVLNGLPESQIYYLYDRLKNCRVDSLSQTSMIIAGHSFPVYFRLDQQPKIDDVVARNFHCMLVSTNFPLCPANERFFIYPFDMVEEPVSLNWFEIPRIKGRSSITYEMLSNTKGYKFVGMRDKLDGICFMGVTLGGKHYMVGSFWFEVRFPIQQAEWIRNTQEFKVLYPVIPCPSLQEGIFLFVYHPVLNFDAREAQKYKEGVMIFVSKEDQVEEYRMKRYNSVELQITNNIVLEQILEKDYSDGVWECIKEGDKIVPLRPRPSKSVSSRIIEKLLLFPQLYSLAESAHPPNCILYRETTMFEVKQLSGYPIPVRDHVEGIYCSDGRWFYIFQWYFASGILFNKRFFFQKIITVPGVLSSKNNKHVVASNNTFSTSKYLMVSPTEALCHTIYSDGHLPNLPDQGGERGTALLSIVAGDVGLVFESGKLYTLPGGKFDWEEESVFDCLERELNEELSPGWERIVAYGPYVSEGCSYFFTNKLVPGLTYMSSNLSCVHPYVRRVALAAQNEAVQLQMSRSNLASFHESDKKLTHACLGEFLDDGPKSLSEVRKQFGSNWANDHDAQHSVVFGNMVYSLEEFGRNRYIQQNMNNLINRDRAIRMSRYLPCSFNTLVAKSGFDERVVNDLLLVMPVERKDNQIHWKY